MKASWIRALAAIILLAPLVAAAASFGITRAQDDAATGGLVLPVFGQIDGQDGTFQGTVSSLRFLTDGQTLSMSGVLNGLVGIGEDSVRVADQQFDTPVEPSVAGAAVAEGGVRFGAGWRARICSRQPHPA